MTEEGGKMRKLPCGLIKVLPIGVEGLLGEVVPQVLLWELAEGARVGDLE